MSRTGVRVALVTGFLLVAVVALFAVRSYERTLAEGRVVLLELAPVDPRSLMQGDYMSLAFAVDRELAAALSALAERGGEPPRFAYLALDADGRGSFAGIGDSLPPAEDGRVVLRIRTRHGVPSIGPNAYFFQEGTADRFEAARWGEFRVAAHGNALLTHLRNEELERL